MSKCNIDHSDFENNGLITKIWGGPAWDFCHAVTFGYPINPTDNDKIRYKSFFISLGNVLPCRFCRESYHKFINDEEETRLSDDVMKNRETLTRWFYHIHNRVNKKLDMNYGITFEDLVAKYESYRAKCDSKNHLGCTVPLHYKSHSFRNFYNKDAPIIPLEITLAFIPYAKQKIKNDHFSFIEYVTELKIDKDLSLLKKSKCWLYRNIFCIKQIQYMRENTIDSIDENGMPSTDELLLIIFMCSNICIAELNNLVQKINQKN